MFLRQARFGVFVSGTRNAEANREVGNSPLPSGRLRILLCALLNRQLEAQRIIRARFRIRLIW